MTTQPDEQRAAMTEALAALRDIHAGWRYIRSVHGDLYGVGWDRAENKAAKAMETLSAALSALPAGGWKAIESAPKDGTEIIGWRDGDVRVCSWEPLDSPVAAHLGASGKSLIGGNFAPTHWMPLPAAPQLQENPK